MSFPIEVHELISVAAVYVDDGDPFTAADRLQLAAERLRKIAVDQGWPSPPLKPVDADIQHLLDTLAFDAELNEACDGAMSLEARGLEATARRLVHEAGYALPKARGETA